MQTESAHLLLLNSLIDQERSSQRTLLGILWMMCVLFHIVV